MATLDARDYSPDGPHAGTSLDPWPGESIKLAIEDTASGDTVFVADGIWLFDAALTVNVSNWTLQGQSQANTILRFETPGQLWFGSTGAGFSNTTLTTMTVDCNTLDNTSNQAAIRFTNLINHTFTNIKELGHANGAVPGIFWEGGQFISITSNNFLGAPAGGDNTCQIQTGPTGSADSDCTISGNTFDSTQCVTIGIDNATVSNNTFTNTAMDNAIGILCCGKFGTTCSNTIVDGNIVNARTVNQAFIAGVPNDPGGASIIDNFRITNNTITGSRAFISVQSIDGNNYNDETLLNNIKTNVVITGNTLNTDSNIGSLINIKGGAGSVGPILVRNNTFNSAVGLTNDIESDATTHDATVCGNTIVSGLGSGPDFEPCGNTVLLGQACL